MEAKVGTRTSKGRKSFRKSSYPKILSNNLDRRIELLDEASTNPHLQNILYKQCRDDITFFFNYFLWTFNPKVEPNHFPFLLYPVQAELAKSYQDEIKRGVGSLTEKSREVGATYVCLGVHLHQWIFEEGFESLLLSMREDEVDNPTPSSLFGKIRYMNDRLPFWLRPFKFNRRINQKHLTFTNPDNGNSIVGQATTEDAGRSGRKSAVLIDEYASISPRLVRGLEVALNETTNCIQRLSTPKGINQFKAIRDRGLCRVHTVHWTRIPPKLDGLYYINSSGRKIDLDPSDTSKINPYGYLKGKTGKTTKFRVRSAWYDQKCKDYLHERDRAQELDINYLGSGYCRFDGDMIETGSANTRDGIRGRLEMVGGKPKFVEVEAGAPFELEVWKFPTVPHYDYRSVIGVDVAEGLEKGDYCSADVLQKDPFTGKINLVASLHGHFTPDVWAEKITRLGFWYDGGAELGVERNKDGLGVLISCRENHNYINIYRGDDDRDGFLTKQSNKFTITGDLDEALRSGELVVESINHFTELSMFENNDGKLGATGENHDDRVMSLAIAWHIIKQYGTPKEKPIGKAERKKIKRFDTSRF